MEMALIIIAIVCVVIVIIVIATKSPSQPEDKSMRCTGYSERMVQAKQIAERQGDTEALQAIERGEYDQLLIRRAKERKDDAEMLVKMPTKKNTQRHSPNYSTSSDYYLYLDYPIAGISYREGIEDHIGSFRGYLKEEPTNRHDPNAIAVYNHNGHHLGYIPAVQTEDVRGLKLPFPIPITGYIEEAEGCVGPYFRGEIHIEHPKDRGYR